MRNGNPLIFVGRWWVKYCVFGGGTENSVVLEKESC